TTPHSQVPNCIHRGWSSPSWWRMATSCFWSICPWSPPRISRATSPGITRMIRNTRVAAPSSVGMIRSSRFMMYVRIGRWPSSVRGQPDVLKLLVRVVAGRRHVVVHLGPVHDVARPPETGHVVGLLQHALLHVDDQLLA